MEIIAYKGASAEGCVNIISSDGDRCSLISAAINSLELMARCVVCIWF